MSVRTGAKRHTHKYHNINGVWHCALNNCTHFMPGNMSGNMPGKSTICWGCSREFLLDDASLTMDKPKCPSCDVPELDILADILASKGL